ncbi:hypothetical protein WJX84_002637 [Apatococcus fuscideae]|uniref:CSC1/OSCA1-like N-terminal transmembrane domain-containing protein n=1 Tax=Apatococcus fuscideae TaxID=2026836 RepID=A0AAW1SZ24_9CHLO
MPALLEFCECARAPGLFDLQRPSTRPLSARVTDNQIVTSIWFDLAFGAIFLLLFGILRSRFAIYRSRELLPQVWIKPPPMPQGGFHQFWSWLGPIFTVTDMDLLHSAGLDALIISWMNLLGIQIFLPLAVLGCVMLIPVYKIHGDRIRKNAADDVKHVASASAFNELTASNLSHGSAYYWFTFVYVYIATAWICWLLTRYYKSYLVLRQRYVMCGEEEVNVWTQHYSGEKTSQSRQLQGKSNPFMQIRRLVDPTALDSILEEGPELEHRGLATSSVQRLARMNAKRSMSAASSAASSSAGSSGSPRAVPSTHLRKGSPLKPRAIAMGPLPDADMLLPQGTKGPALSGPPSAYHTPDRHSAELEASSEAQEAAHGNMALGLTGDPATPHFKFSTDEARVARRWVNKAPDLHERIGLAGAVGIGRSFSPE